MRTYLFIDTIKYYLPNMDGIAIYQEEVEVVHLVEDNHMERMELVQDEEGNKVAVDTLDTGYILQALEYKADRA